MIEAGGTGGQGLLEHHDALVGLAPEQLHCKGPAGCRGHEMLAAASGYDKALCCGHARILHLAELRINPRVSVHQPWPTGAVKYSRTPHFSKVMDRNLLILEIGYNYPL